MRIVISASFTLLLGACFAQDDSPPALAFDPCSPLTITPSGEMSDAEAASIEEGVALWNQELGTEVRFGEPELGDEVVPVSYDEAAPLFYGVYLDDVGEIILNHEVQDPDARRIVVLHELGHTFGLAHVKPGDRASVMNPGNLDISVTTADVDAVIDHWGSCQ